MSGTEKLLGRAREEMREWRRCGRDGFYRRRIDQIRRQRKPDGSHSTARDVEQLR
jgi:hypothetical protein